MATQTSIPAAANTGKSTGKPLAETLPSRTGGERADQRERTGHALSRRAMRTGSDDGIRQLSGSGEMG